MDQVSTSNHIARRGFLRGLAAAATTGLSAASLPQLSLGAEGGQVSQGLSMYKTPETSMQVSQEWFLDQRPCRLAQRLDFHLQGGLTSKLFVGPEGGYLVRPLESLVQEGWDKRMHQLLRQNTRLTANSRHGDPDIKPCQGSGVLVQLPGGERSFFSNDHVLCSARSELEKRRISIWEFDIARIDPRWINLQTNDKPLPVAQIATESAATNQTLPENEVEIYGFGADLRLFVGKPFRIPITIPELGEKFGQRDIFGLRLSDGAVNTIAEISGMSGSPVVLHKTKEVVGLVCRVFYSLKDGKSATVILFAGPDELRDLARRDE
ncbi:MAG: hypothetical protein ACK5HO_11640 [Pseudomonadota bacterium]|jgi:hypothetical protein